MAPIIKTGINNFLLIIKKLFLPQKGEPDIFFFPQKFNTNETRRKAGGTKTL